jgi:hypothetical protein
LGNSLDRRASIQCVVDVTLTLIAKCDAFKERIANDIERKLSVVSRLK